jgi:hypothetical protein
MIFELDTEPRYECDDDAAFATPRNTLGKSSPVRALYSANPAWRARLLSFLNMLRTKNPKTYAPSTTKRFDANPSKCFQRHLREVQGEKANREKLKFDGTERIVRVPIECATEMIEDHEWFGKRTAHSAVHLLISKHPLNLCSAFLQCRSLRTAPKALIVIFAPVPGVHVALTAARVSSCRQAVVVMRISSLHCILRLQDELDLALLVQAYALADVNAFQREQFYFTVVRDAVHPAVLYPIFLCKKGSTSFQRDNR